MGEIAFVWVVILLTAIQNFAYKVLHIALFLTVELNYPVLKKVETTKNKRVVVWVWICPETFLFY